MMRSSILLMLTVALALWGAAAAQAEDAETSPAALPSEAQETDAAPQGAADTPESAGAQPADAAEAQPAESEPAAPADQMESAEAEMEPASAEPEAETAMDDPEPELPAPAAAEPAPATAPSGTTLGAVGYDSEGRAGRIHVVVRGDTLWDISDAYLGTPWVWPSIWQDNRDIENPHWIYPGDLIWITDSEMRVITPEEAEALMAGAPAAAEPEPLETEELEPVFEEVPVPAAPPLTDSSRTIRVSLREGAGFVTSDDYEASASVVDSFENKAMLSQGDEVYIGLGAGDVSPGDQFTVYRMEERVFDPDTGRLLGYHVDVLGWLQVEEPGTEASLARIRESHSEMQRGDRLVPREPLPAEIAVLPAPQGLEGKVSFFAKSRTMVHQSDFVYVNRGTLDGVEVGSPLEVYRPVYTAAEPARHTRVEVPDRVVAQLLVVKAAPESAVAFVTHTEDEIELGDHVRGATR